MSARRSWVEDIEQQAQSDSQVCLSKDLEDLASETDRERVSVEELLTGLGDRAPSVLIFILSAPNVLPLGVPGMSAVLGLPLFFLTWRMMLGRTGVWLPERLRRQSIAQAAFARTVSSVLPWLRRLERLTRARLPYFSGGYAHRIVGGVGVILAAIISLPIPFGNALPGVALATLSLGLFERDGLVVAIGAFATVLSVLATVFILWTLGNVGIWIFGASSNLH